MSEDGEAPGVPSDSSATRRVEATGGPGEISVALSLYNSARFIDEQLDSILGQSQLPAQIVVGDDGSTDGSLEAVESARARARRSGLDIEWTILDASEHHGLRQNMTRILAACQRDVIIVCDSDDVCLPDRFERTLQWFRDHPGDLMVATDATVIDQAGTAVAPSMMSKRGLSEEEWSHLRSDRAFELLVRRFIISGATSSYRRQLIELAPPCPEPFVRRARGESGLDAWYALMAAAMTAFGFDDQPSIQYRVHGTNNSGGVQARTTMDKLRMLVVPGEGRNARLLDRADAVLDAIETLRSRVPDWVYDLAQASAEHQHARANFPRNRLRRAPKVLRHAATGAYGRSARGSKDVLLDLFQPVE